MIPSFKLLLENSLLTTEDYKIIANSNLQQALGMPFYSLNISEKPYIFSCFALSVDGGLCYPDLKTGYAIAKCNHAATQQERYADWWNLNLGRAISDAVIVGSNTLINEHGKYIAVIDIAELQILRQQLGKADKLLHILTCIDMNELDWQQEVLVHDDTPVIVFTKIALKCLPEGFTTVDKYNPAVLKQVIINSELALDNLIIDLYDAGIKTILNESPYYHHYLQEKQLLDEAWINTSGVYIGGNIAKLGRLNQSFSAYNHPHYTILSLHSCEYNFLYTRYKITYSA